MAQDIVDYLRDQRWNIARGDEAAAEIERLRGMHQDMCRVSGELVESNERLRAAGAELINSAALSEDGRLATIPISVYGMFYGAYINDPDDAPEQTEQADAEEDEPRHNPDAFHIDGR